MFNPVGWIIRWIVELSISYNITLSSETTLFVFFRHNISSDLLHFFIYLYRKARDIDNVSINKKYESSVVRNNRVFWLKDK